MRYTAEKAKINNQNLTFLEREAKLEEAAAKNNLRLLQINKQYTETVKQREETRIKTFEGLQLELDKYNATTKRAKELLQIDADALELQRQGVLRTEEQIEQYKRFRTEVFDKTNLTEFEEAVNNLLNTVGVALKNAMETALVDTIAAAISGADDLNEKLQQTASSLLTTLGKAFVNFGISSLAGTDGRGFFSFLQGGLGRAEGGPVSAGKPYIVGEREPELFVPNSAGTIYNQEQMRTAMSTYSYGSQQQAFAGR